MFKKDVAAVLLFMLVGCANQPSAQDETIVLADKLLHEKLEIASNANREYGAAILENHATLPRKQVVFEHDRLQIDYIGKPQALLQTLANRYGYEYIEIGKYADLPTINIRQANITPEFLINDVKSQINETADVVLDKSSKTVRLIYRSMYFNGRG